MKLDKTKAYRSNRHGCGSFEEQGFGIRRIAVDGDLFEPLALRPKRPSSAGEFLGVLAT